MKSCVGKRCDEDISHLISLVKVTNLNCLVLNILINKMKVNGYMLHLFMKNKIRANVVCANVVTKNNWWSKKDRWSSRSKFISLLTLEKKAATTWYLASIDEWETDFCFLEDQGTGEFPRKTNFYFLEDQETIDVLSCEFPSQSQSE